MNRAIVSVVCVLCVITVHKALGQFECVVFTQTTGSCSVTHPNPEPECEEVVCDPQVGCDPNWFRRVEEEDYYKTWDAYRLAVGTESGYNFEENSGQEFHCIVEGDCDCVLRLGTMTHYCIEVNSYHPHTYERFTPNINDPCPDE